MYVMRMYVYRYIYIYRCIYVCVHVYTSEASARFVPSRGRLSDLGPSARISVKTEPELSCGAGGLGLRAWGSGLRVWVEGSGLWVECNYSIVGGWLRV